MGEVACRAGGLTELYVLELVEGVQGILHKTLLRLFCAVYRIVGYQDIAV
jgi:hypothetical protein